MDVEKDVETYRFEHTIRATQNASTYVKTGKTIVIALDGTGDSFDADNTNIVTLVSTLKKSSPEQAVYYQSGIGTYDEGGMSSSLNSAFDSAVGSGLGVHIRDAYQFLMQNYNDNDKICIFGFSRGSYTARCLAGMIHKVGILPAYNYSQIQFAYKLYKDDSTRGWEMSKEFKAAFCMNVNVWFVGVYDSVASVGFIPRKLPLSATPNNQSRYFRHCIAMDEHRAKFQICRFRQKLGSGKDSWKVSTEMTPTEARFSDAHLRTDVLETFWLGAHCDVGGGSEKNETRHKLANIPLRWMIRQCFECNTGILFKTHALAMIGLDIHTMTPVYQRPSSVPMEPSKEILARYNDGTLPALSRRSHILEQASDKDENGSGGLKISSSKQNIEFGWLPEGVEDYFDLQANINDQLKKSKTWWILEVFPVKLRIHQGEDWVKRVRMNLGRHRGVQEHQPNLHWSAKYRMDHHGYENKLRMDPKAKWNIVY